MENDGIFLIKGGELVVLQHTPYESEDLLQKALADFLTLFRVKLRREAAPPRNRGARGTTVERLASEPRNAGREMLQLGRLPFQLESQGVIRTASRATRRTKRWFDRCAFHVDKGQASPQCDPSTCLSGTSRPSSDAELRNASQLSSGASS